MLKILSWNIACLPQKINTLKNSTKRLKSITKFIELSKPDIICFQEVFSSESRIYLKQYLKNNKYYIYLSPHKNILLNGGLLIASKFEIIDLDNIIFNNSLGEDCLSDKGILYIKIKYNNKYINIFNTHLNNATPMYSINRHDEGKIIRYQLNEFLQFFYNKIKNNTSNIYLLVGDFNLPYESLYYNKFINKIKKNLKIYRNTNEIITDNINNIQIDYINTCCHKDIEIKDFKIYTSDKFKKISDHNPLIKKIIL